MHVSILLIYSLLFNFSSVGLYISAFSLFYLKYNRAHSYIIYANCFLMSSATFVTFALLSSRTDVSTPWQINLIMSDSNTAELKVMIDKAHAKYLSWKSGASNSPLNACSSRVIEAINKATGAKFEISCSGKYTGNLY